MGERRPTLLLSVLNVAAALDLPECIAAVEEGFRALGEGRTPPSEVLALHSEHGGLHVKAARWQNYFVAKANANFPQNPARHALPAILGYGAVCDAATGELLEELLVSSTNQEHGIITARTGDLDLERLPVGSRVRILPNHACATAAQHPHYDVIAGEPVVEAVWPRFSGW